MREIKMIHVHFKVSTDRWCSLSNTETPKKLQSDSIVNMFEVVHEHRKKSNPKNRFRGMHFLWAKGVGCRFLCSPLGLGYDHWPLD